jgi:hypothetical protein
MKTKNQVIEKANKLRRKTVFTKQIPLLSNGFVCLKSDRQYSFDYFSGSVRVPIASLYDVNYFEF